MQKCVESFIEGRNSWQLGFTGFLTRIRGIAFAVFLSIVTMGSAPFWWLKRIDASHTVQLRYVLLCGLTSGALLFILTLFYIRKRTRRSLDVKFYLHEFSHYLRDFQTKLVNRNSKSTVTTEEIEDERFTTFVANICERVKEYFRLIYNDGTLECAIRLAIETGDENNTVGYMTIGRSKGLSEARSKTSENIPANEGLARFLIENNSQGVLIYNDLEEAAKLMLYKLTKNDEKYKNEISTMMVVPLNAWDGKKQSMIGILYITSRERNVFKVKQVDSARFLADMIAFSISFVVENLKSLGRMSILSRRSA